MLTLEPFAEKLITSADNRFAALSKEIRVLVESSKKRFTTVRPRKVGSFFIGPSEIFANSFAVSRISIASCALRSLIDSKCLIIYAPAIISTQSLPSISSSETFTDSLAAVGIFFPT